MRWILVLITLSLLLGCEMSREKSAQITAERIARHLESGEWDEFYDLAIPELRAEASREMFAYNSEYDLKVKESLPNVIRLDKLLMDNKKSAYAYYTAYYGASELKLSAVHLVWLGNGWYYDAFAPSFLYDRKAETQANEIILGILEPIITFFKKDKEFLDQIDMYDDYDVAVNYGTVYYNFICPSLQDSKNKLEGKITELTNYISRQTKLDPKFISKTTCYMEMANLLVNVFKIQEYLCETATDWVNWDKLGKLDNLRKEISEKKCDV